MRSAEFGWIVLYPRSRSSNRNLERLRGFDTSCGALPIIQRQHTTVRVVIVGDNEGGYGGAHHSGLPLRR